MLDDALRAKLDQASATLVEMFPPLWRQLYDGCAKEGFSDSESLELVKAYILSQAANGINGTT